ncbi:MAG: hypothetical protein L6R45_21980 [Anaerolineae bacterium]|nr:hypothetical protein [Anaerolineae bacterium]
MNDESLTLRQLITERLTAIEGELRVLRAAIETIDDRQMRHSEFENLKLQVAGLVEAVNELEHRVIQLEQHKSLASWVFRQSLTIAAIVTIIYLLGVLR